VLRALSLHRYFERVYDLVLSREEIRVEEFRSTFSSTGQTSTLYIILRFWNGSVLYASETLEAKGLSFVKTEYRYHFQDAENVLIFRYDNTPHHPEIPTHPHHKHTSKGLEPASPPNLWDILRETDTHLYGE